MGLLSSESMQISAQRVDEFKSLYKARFGVELSQEEASESASRFMRLVEAVYSVPVNENEKDLWTSH